MLYAIILMAFKRFIDYLDGNPIDVRRMILLSARPAYAKDYMSMTLMSAALGFVMICLESSDQYL